MTDRQNRWLLFCLIWGFAILVLVAAAVLISPRAAHGQCPPGSSSCCPPSIGAGVFGPQGGWVGARVGGGGGIQAGVGGPYGGVVGAQVGPGARVQAGVIPGQGFSQPSSRTTSGLSPALVAVISKIGNRTRPGSGVWVVDLEGKAVVLTAAHCLFDGGTITIRSGGQEAPARLVAKDEANDLAVIAISRPIGTVQALRLSGVPIGAPATIQGFPAGSGPSSISGQVMEFGSGEVVVRCQATEGMSGGPIFGPGGLYGILTGGDQSRGYWTAWGPDAGCIRRLLDQAGPPNAGEQGNGDLPGDVSGQGPPAADYLPPRPVVSVTRDEFTAAMDAIKARDQKIVDRLMVHSEALADHDGRLANYGGRITALENLPAVEPVDLSAVNARLTALEAGLQRPIGFVDRYMTPDPNGDHEYMGRKYSLRDEQHETVALGQSRVTYYYPLEQRGGDVAPANP